MILQNTFPSEDIRSITKLGSETILASEAEADRSEVISHEQLEKESKGWIKQASRQKSMKSNGQKRRSGR
jgi:hypothetical protein